MISFFLLVFHVLVIDFNLHRAAKHNGIQGSDLPYARKRIGVLVYY